MNRMGLLIVATVALVGCASSYVVDAGPEAAVTYDGLVPVDSSNVENFWAKPDVDYTSYTKVLLLPPEFEFRMQDHDAEGRVSTEEFPLSEADKQSLAETVHGIFLEELASNQYFTFVEEPGPDVMSLEGRILDFVALVPKRGERDDSGEVYFSSVGEMTLVVEAHDSLTGEILVRAVERRAAGGAFEGIHSSRKNGWAEIKPVARHWAGLIRERLDQIHEVGTIF
jgi:hypothetical protein